MTDEEMRIKIAEACGWIHHHMRPSETERHQKKWRYLSDLPNYPEDLNACAEFEATLTDDELWEYSKLLMDYRQAANGFPLASRSEVLKLQKATARHRCTAFLKTKGLIP